MFILIPYLSDGVTVDLNEVEVFESHDAAETHAHAMGFYYYDIVKK